MNLLEHYIKEIHEVKDVTDEFTKRCGKKPYQPLFKVDLTYDCYGQTERKTMSFFKDELEQAKEKGYFMA